MSDIPTLEEVEAAAVTLEKMSKLYQYYDPPNANWSPTDLRYEMRTLRSVLDREELIDEIIAELEDPQINVDLRTILRGYDIRREL